MPTPNWLWRMPLNIISREATNCGLDRDLVAAIIMVESSGSDYAARYEDHWRYFCKVEYHAKRNRISFDTERMLQATSWGHMQVMGSVCRELGYDGPLLRVGQPLLGIKWGCIKLKEVHSRYSKLEDVISSYNQGSPRMVGDRYRNQAYVDKVLGYLHELKA